MAESCIKCMRKGDFLLVENEIEQQYEGIISNDGILSKNHEHLKAQSRTFENVTAGELAAVDQFGALLNEAYADLHSFNRGMLRRIDASLEAIDTIDCSDAVLVCPRILHMQKLVTDIGTRFAAQDAGTEPTA